MLKEVFFYFFRLGFIAFGGPAAHTALMQKELVDEKNWLTTEDFLDYVGITNLIPGPNSTELTMHCGYHRAGVAGLFVAGFSFIFPAVLLTLLVSIFFEKYSDIEWMIPIVNGIKASVISFIVGAIFKLGKKAITSSILLVMGILVVIGSLWGINELVLIFGAGFLWIAIKLGPFRDRFNSFMIFPLFGLLPLGFSQLKLFLVFLKIGAILFGSGYVLFAYLDTELIEGLAWLTHEDLVEAVAIGQVTPGPILSTSTFIGYKLGGVSGALLASLGIFLPSFFYVLLLNKYILTMRKSKLLKTFLQGVNVAAVAVMLVVGLKMGESILIGWETSLICLLGFILYFTFPKLNSLWIIFMGAILGWILSIITF